MTKLSINKSNLINKKVVSKFFLFSGLFESSCGLSTSFAQRNFSSAVSTENSSNESVRVLGQQYHVLDFSPWPALLCLSLLGNMSWMVVWMFYLAPFICVFFSFLVTVFTMGCWWWDAHYEGLKEGQHTAAVVRGMRIGMVLFIISEVFFFIAFFWAYFHNALNPSVYIGGVWPPYGLIPYSFNPSQLLHYSAVNFALMLLDIPGCLPPGVVSPFAKTAEGLSAVAADVLQNNSVEFCDWLLAHEGVKNFGSAFSLINEISNRSDEEINSLVNEFLKERHVPVVLSLPDLLPEAPSPLHTLVGTSTWNPYNMPLAMTLILVTSGFTLTASHVALCIKYGSLNAALRPLAVTLVLAVSFLLLQAFEYVNLPISINDGIFGSTFFMATGFHGFHVLVGSIFLAVCLVRMYKRFFACDDHFSLEAAAWYWHFVDVVWIFLFAAMYWWARPDDYVLFYFDPPEL
jgi:heme/copper-type cytochrome/quinol oxidase subunit 3